jgi:hypothetical protein
MTTPTTQFFGIRHHGPGCARSLLQALNAWNPDCLLIEGPPEADELLVHAADPELRPPVALLVHCPAEPTLASFYPLADFSPEWQAMSWAARTSVPTRFIDLPQTHAMAMRKARDDAEKAEIAAKEPATETEAEAESDNALPANPENDPHDPGSDQATDPLGWLAEAAGYSDGESWWNHMVEERGDGTDLFTAIAEAMREVRGQAPVPTGWRAERENLREAHMRTCIRQAQAQGHQRIAVVCGAWHVPALEGDIANSKTVKADAQLLKGLPKLKVAATWVPWSYPHLSSHSGYGAGVDSPGWYDYLWQHTAHTSRAIGWLTRVARLLRDEGLDCSSAHVIEGVRLAETVAALRNRPAPGLDELNEACVTVLCHGEAAPLALIQKRLIVGDRLGHIPEGVPAVPLQQDIDQQQKTLRLKPEALAKTLDLDLRKENDLARSRLLHRLRLLDIAWGNLSQTGHSAKGTFHEIWNLQWQPEFVINVITASRWGNTVEQAAVALAAERIQSIDSLSELAQLMDQVMLANLPAAVSAVAQALDDRAAVTGDAAQLLATLPPLANALRYGSVRQTDANLLADLFDRIVLRASIGLSLACISLDEDAADAMRKNLLDADRAIALRKVESVLKPWQNALKKLSNSEQAAPLLRGVAARLLLDASLLPPELASQLLARNLSTGADPQQAAAWLDGFLNRNATVLLHDEVVWGLVDDWISGLSDDNFVRVLPLIRRTFAAFEAAERRDLSGRVRRPAGGVVKTQVATWDEDRAQLPVPLLRLLLNA